MMPPLSLRTGSRPDVLVSTDAERCDDDHAE